MVASSQAIVIAEASLESPVTRRVWARSQEHAHDRALLITAQMRAEGRILIARSWVSHRRGGMVTLVFRSTDVELDGAAD